jgi:tRNA pseudouridine38-40 synthase
MTRYKLTFEYDGTHFSGWQKQPDARTVEGVIEKAFATLYQQEIDIVGQGRTDAGVHARGQTAHVDLPSRYDEDKILHAMKGLLPADVALLKIEKTHPGFHARFDANSRRYRYMIISRPSPLQRNYSWYVFSNLDEELLNQCADLILGEHDFINFCIPADDEFMTTLCTISESRWIPQGDILIYEITGNRFLRHLVRRLVGTMVNVSDGKLTIEEFEALLRGKNTDTKGHTAPAKGLILEQVVYQGKILS